MITPSAWKLWSARIRYVEVWSGLFAAFFQYKKHDKAYNKAHAE